MRRPHVLAIIQAGGEGSRMDVLTRERAKPALPFAGVFQLVDFPLSNLANSGVTDVWLSVQYQGTTIAEQVATGRPWDLDRTHGGLRLLAPQQGTGTLDEDGFARGNADELFRIRDEIAAVGPDVVLVMSADHVYRLDLADVVDHHLEAGAACTVVTTEVALSEAGDHATVRVEDGRVVGFDYKPDDPDTGVVATEVFAYDPEVLVATLEELHRDLGGEAEAGDTGLGDFGEHLVPHLVEHAVVTAFALPGYWRDLGQPHHYLRAHLDVLDDGAGVLGVAEWPIFTQQPQRPPARIREGAVVADSLVSPGSEVSGAVRRSVLGPGVVVEAGAEVVHSVVFADTVVRAGAVVAGAVVDTGCEIGPDAVVGAPDADLDDPDQVALVGRGCTVGDGVTVAAGARLEPGTTA
jgi:glucose-1-phosphate adenylyltransferase